MIWAWFLGFSALAILLAALPSLTRRFGAPTAESERGKMIGFYRDGLRRLKRDVARGLIPAGEAARLRAEGERRLLQAAEGEKGTPTTPANRFASSVIPAAAIALLAGAAYTLTGRPFDAAPRPPAPDIMAAATGEEGPTIGELVGELERHLAGKPGDIEGWMLLGNTYRGLGKFSDAAGAYEKALGLSPAPAVEADLLARRAEAFTLMSGGLVTEAAKFDLARALAIDPAHPIARYYDGLGYFQSGRGAAGLAAWEKLYAELPPETPWRENLMEEIRVAKAIMGLKED